MDITGSAKKVIEPQESLREEGRIRCQEQLGVMLNYYYREAA